MSPTTDKIIALVWAVACDCLSNEEMKNKCPRVTLPLVALCRLDALLEPAKNKVTEAMVHQKESPDWTTWNKEDLCAASGYAFYNTSLHSLQYLHDTAANNEQLLAGFENYLHGFSPNVQEIMNKLGLSEQVRCLAGKGVLVQVLGKLTLPDINWSPLEKKGSNGNKMPALSHQEMSQVFAELVSRLDKATNPKARGHITPHAVTNLMTRLVFEPFGETMPTDMSIYDPACGLGGFLVEALRFVPGTIHLHGKEINDEAWAISKVNLLMRGYDPKNIYNGSSLAANKFHGNYFDGMLSNPPWGKSWRDARKFIKWGSNIIDYRFRVPLADIGEEAKVVAATPDFSDGQLLFLMDMISKMKNPDRTLGSRIASLHSGAALTAGGVGTGEDHIRRYIVGQDWLEAIIRLPDYLFPDQKEGGYIWLLSNNKADHRKGKIQLIDARAVYKELGNESRVLAPEHICKIMQTYANPNEEKGGIDMDHEQRVAVPGVASKTFDSQDFFYHRIAIDQPSRLKWQFTPEGIASLRYDKTLHKPMEWAYTTFGNRVYTELDMLEDDMLAWCKQNKAHLSRKQRKALISAQTWAKQQPVLEIAERLLRVMDKKIYDDFHELERDMNEALYELGIEADWDTRETIREAISWYDARAAKIIRNTVWQKDPITDKTRARYSGVYPGYYPNEYVRYRAESNLRTYEEVPVGRDIYDYFIWEVCAHASDAWIDTDATRMGCKINFSKIFYYPKPLPCEPLAEDILAMRKKNSGLLPKISDNGGQVDKALQSIEQVIGMKQKYAACDDSGELWLGQVPVHWVVKKLKFVAKIQVGDQLKTRGANAGFFAGKGLDWLTLADFDAPGKVINPRKKLNEKGIQQVSVFPTQSVYMAGVHTHLGKVVMLAKEGSANQHIQVIMPDATQAIARFVYYLLKAAHNYIINVADYRKTIDPESVGELKLVFPPLREQAAIVDFLEKTCTEAELVIDKMKATLKGVNIASQPGDVIKAITERKQRITELEAYKEGLIYNLVTGKQKIT